LNIQRAPAESHRSRTPSAAQAKPSLAALIEPVNYAKPPQVEKGGGLSGCLMSARQQKAGGLPNASVGGSWVARGQKLGEAGRFADATG
jgi:hypothetical protein